MSFETTALLVTWVAIVLLALVVAGLVRQVHHLAQGPRATGVGPSPGMPAPGLAGLAPEPGRPTLLLFLDDDCPACRDVFDEALRLTGAPPTRAVFAGGAPAADPPAHLRVLTDGSALFEEYQVPATPFAVLVGADGRIRTAEPVGSVRALHGIVVQGGGRVDPGGDAGHTGPGADEEAGVRAGTATPGVAGDVPAGSGPVGRRK